MKYIQAPHRRSSSHGFTLVELLVVIGIIAILAAVITTAASGALRAARRVQAQNMATQIQTACLNYYTEYSVYPVPSTATASTDYVITDTTGDAAAWGLLLEALSGNVRPSTGALIAATTITNTRSIAFLSLKASDVDANDAPLNPLPGSANANKYFNIAMDYDYDGILGGNSTSTGKLPNFLTAVLGTTPPLTGSSTAGVAVWANCNSTLGKNNPNWWVHTY